MSTLYRNYRPEKFKDIFGQNHIKIGLENELINNTLSQSYLFCGPRAVGKTTMARVLAKSINCLDRKKGSAEPCGKCDSCLSINRSSNLDVIEIDAASNTGVDNVRDNIISFAKLNPSQAKCKVFIIDEVHMLSISAFNALLKIIEEPPKDVVFILCTTEVHKVPKTIISRCQRYDFRRISSSEIIKKLEIIADKEKIKINNDVLLAIAKESDGHLRDAESLMGQILSLGETKIDLEVASIVLPKNNSKEAVDLILALSKNKASEALEIVNNLVDSGVELKNFIKELILILRKILINFVNPKLADGLDLKMGDIFEKEILELLDNLEVSKTINYIEKFSKVLNEKNNLLSQLPLEIAIIELTYNIKEKEDKEPKLINNEIREKIEDKKNVNVKEENLETSLLNIDCQKVKDKWPEFLMKIKKYNHSLSFILQNCQAKDLKSGELNLEFKYKFHHDRALDINVRPIIEKTLSEVFSSPVKIKAVLNEKMESIKNEENEESDEISPENLIKTFGGQIAS